MMDDFRTRLMSCPFCGSAGELELDGARFVIHCSNEDCAAFILGADGFSPSEAAAMWNKRPADDGRWEGR